MVLLIYGQSWGLNLVAHRSTTWRQIIGLGRKLGSVAGSPVGSVARPVRSRILRRPHQKFQDPIMDPPSEGFTCPSGPMETNSPISPLRKTRIISSSLARSTAQCHTAASPVNLRIQQSPFGSGQLHAGFSLRRNKRAARQPGNVPKQSSPQSILLNSPVRIEWDDCGKVGYCRLVDDSKLPVLQPPPGIGKVGPRYVTRSLFRDYVPELSENSQSRTVNLPPAIKTIPVSKLVGVSVDVLTPEELAGCIMCDRELLCSELVCEFTDDIAMLKKSQKGLETPFTHSNSQRTMAATGTVDLPVMGRVLLQTATLIIVLRRLHGRTCLVWDFYSGMPGMRSNHLNASSQTRTGPLILPNSRITPPSRGL
ncbi:hypothetical protein R1sor_001539 [Riccia sorocarpa]|uniref:Uncharacterized protein n=1 Tax=Riccia sorocarpa TaxID=122646 RepID=A0ABD3GYP8_9MARC